MNLLIGAFKPSCHISISFADGKTRKQSFTHEERRRKSQFRRRERERERERVWSLWTWRRRAEKNRGRDLGKRRRRRRETDLGKRRGEKKREEEIWEEIREGGRRKLKPRRKGGRRCTWRSWSWSWTLEWMAGLAWESTTVCRCTVPLKKENGQTVTVPLFQSQENIVGEVVIEPQQGKKVEHIGVKIELLGQIELYFDRGNFYDFTSLVRELEVPGELYERKTYPFEFSTVEMPYESYNGVNVRLRYILKVTISRNFVGNIVGYQDFVVRNYTPLPSINNSIKMEVGIEDCLHIEFEYNKSKYHLKDVIIGKIYFLLVRIKIKNMELEIRRRESTGAGPNTYVETETLAKYELMDGAPVRGESIPVRLFLSPYELTPTYRNINNKFSVKYYLNLVLVDEEERRYFKQQEINVYRLLETSSDSSA